MTKRSTKVKDQRSRELDSGHGGWPLEILCPPLAGNDDRRLNMGYILRTCRRLERQVARPRPPSAHAGQGQRQKEISRHREQARRTSRAGPGASVLVVVEMLSRGRRDVSKEWQRRFSVSLHSYFTMRRRPIRESRGGEDARAAWTTVLCGLARPC